MPGYVTFRSLYTNPSDSFEMSTLSYQLSLPFWCAIYGGGLRGAHIWPSASHDISRPRLVFLESYVPSSERFPFLAPSFCRDSSVPDRGPRLLLLFLTPLSRSTKVICDCLIHHVRAVSLKIDINTDPCVAAQQAKTGDAFVSNLWVENHNKHKHGVNIQRLRCCIFIMYSCHPSYYAVAQYAMTWRSRSR
jgi:hypothetical protein